MAPVTADGYFPGFRVFGRYSSAELPGESLRKFAAGNAPDVVGSKNVFRERHSLPVCPNPPAPRALCWNSSTIFKFGLLHWHDNQLCDTFADFDSESVAPAIPARDHDFSLVVRVDQSDQIAEHDAVFVAQPGTWQDQRSVTGVCNMNRESGWNQFRLAGFER